uniref:Uncharacterized protein n=1 Tax=Globodera rostochiensis TaxID=31243 RepID=A0A914IBA3_GLORO
MSEFSGGCRLFTFSIVVKLSAGRRRRRLVTKKNVFVSSSFVFGVPSGRAKEINGPTSKRPPRLCFLLPSAAAGVEEAFPLGGWKNERTERVELTPMLGGGERRVSPGGRQKIRRRPGHPIAFPLRGNEVNPSRGREASSTDRRGGLMYDQRKQIDVNLCGGNEKKGRAKKIPVPKKHKIGCRDCESPSFIQTSNAKRMPAGPFFIPINAQIAAH